MEILGSMEGSGSFSSNVQSRGHEHYDLHPKKGEHFFSGPLRGLRMDSTREAGSLSISRKSNFIWE